MGTSRTTSTKIFFRLGHFYLFANLLMEYINSIVMKNFSLQTTKVFISKKLRKYKNLRFLWKEYQMWNKM